MAGRRAGKGKKVASSAEHSWWDSQRLTPQTPHVGTARGAWVSASARAVTARFAAEVVGRMSGPAAAVNHEMACLASKDTMKPRVHRDDAPSPRLHGTGAPPGIRASAGVFERVGEAL